MTTKLDLLCREFSANWSQGSEPRIEDFLQQVDEEQRGALLKQLLAAEIESRRRKHAQPQVSHYLARFPDLADIVRDVFARNSLANEANAQEVATLLPESKVVRPSANHEVSSARVDTDRVDPFEEPTIAPGESPVDEATLPPGRGVELDTLTQFGGQGITIESSAQSGMSLGEYEILGEIARGGMGVVYRARQRRLNRVVALKMILAGQFAGEEDVQRFHAEAEAAANLNHPGIVPIYDVGEYDGQHFFSMGFVDGQSLSEMIADGPLAPRQAAEYAKGIADAIAFAHDHGVIHRDLKPANVLIDASGQPKVTDFGLAKKLKEDSGLTATGQVLGTPNYMPPEQASGKLHEITETSDVYSLGAILYCLLTGRPPFQAATPMETLIQVLEREPPAPRVLNPQTPRDLETIALKCLDKDAKRRYGSAHELRAELDRFLNDEPIHAHPIGNVERAWRWCKRKPVFAGLIGTALLLLLTLSIGGPYIAFQKAEFAERQTDLRRKADEARVDADARRREADDAKSVAVAARQHEAEQRQKAEQATREAELAQANESEARKVAEAERDAKGIALTRAEGLALCAQSNAVRESHPSLALLLAIESVQRTPTSVTFANLYAAREACREVRTLVGHTGDVQDATFSRDGRLIATASTDISMRVWDAASGKMIRSSDLVPQVKSVALSPDGKRVAATTQGATHYRVRSESTVTNLLQKLFGGSNKKGEKQFLHTDRICRVWDSESNTELFRLKSHDDRVTSIEFSADHKHIVTSSWDQTVRLWDADTAEELKVWKSFDGRPLASVCCSNDGRFILAMPENEPRRSNYPTDLIKDLDETDPDAPLADGEAAAIYYHTSDLDVPHVDRPAFAFLIDVEQDKIEALRSSDTELRPADCAIGFNGEQVAVAYWQGFAEVWNVGDLENPAARLSGHGGPVNAIALSHDGKLVATGGDDRTVRIWDAATGKQEAVFRGHSGPVRSVDFGPDSRVVSSGDRTARVWDLQPVKPLARLISGHKAKVVSVEFSPSGDRLVTASDDGTVRVCDASSDQMLLLLDREKLRAQPVFARFSPDGKRFVTSVNAQDPIRVWDAHTGAELISFKDDRGAATASYSSDGKFLMTVSDDHVRNTRNWSVSTNAGHIRIWDAESANRLLSLPIPAPKGLIPSISPDSQWMVAAHREESGTAHVFDIVSSKHLLSLTGHQGAIRNITINPQGEQILTCSDDDTVCLWDAKTGKRIAQLEGFGGDVTLCEYSEDGSQFVTVVNSIANVWDAKTLDLIATLKGHEAAITKARFTPDGSHLFTHSDDQTSAFWEIDSSRMLLLFQAAIDDEVVDADINADGTLVATGSSDGSVRLWPVDIWPSINQRRPRQLTPEERRRYDLLTWQDRLLNQSQSTPHASREGPGPPGNEESTADEQR